MLSKKSFGHKLPKVPFPGFLRVVWKTQSLEPELDLEPDEQKATITKTEKHGDEKSRALILFHGSRFNIFLVPFLSHSQI